MHAVSLEVGLADVSPARQLRSFGARTWTIFAFDTKKELELLICMPTILY